MRIRTIKPEFWTHPVMQKRSDTTKLLAIGLLNYADDDGYFYAEPKAVRNAIRPNDDDSRITTVALRELSDIGYITIRNHDTHGEIGFIHSFSNHQVINKRYPSKIKELYDYGSDTVVIRDSYCEERKGKEIEKEKEIEKQEKENSVCDEVSPKKKTFQSPNYLEFESYLIEAMPLVNPEWTFERVKRAAKLQYDTYDENGWKDGNNNQVKNWKTKAKTALSYKKPWSYGNDEAKPSNPCDNSQGVKIKFFK